MDGNDKRNSVSLLCENPAKVSIPSVTMDDIGIDVRSVEINTPPHGAENRAQWLWTGKIARVQFEADDLEVTFFETLVAKATHFHRHHLRQLTREIAHMHASAAVNVRRILVRDRKSTRLNSSHITISYAVFC